MTKASDNAFPSILITEATEPSAPAAGKQRLYIDSTTHLLKATNSSGTDRTIEGAPAGAITSSGLTQATARLLGRTTASTGAIEEITVGSGLSLAAGSLTATGGSGGSYVWLQRQTASASATLDFTGFISATYTNYEFILNDILPATGSTHLYMRVHTAGGFISASKYSTAGFVFVSSASALFGNAIGALVGQMTTSNAADYSNSTGAGVVGSVKLFNPNSAADFRKVTFDLGFVESAANNMKNSRGSAYYHDTVAVDGFQFLFNSGNIASGTIDVYGLTHA